MWHIYPPTLGRFGCSHETDSNQYQLSDGWSWHDSDWEGGSEILPDGEPQTGGRHHPWQSPGYGPQEGAGRARQLQQQRHDGQLCHIGPAVPGCGRHRRRDRQRTCGRDELRQRRLHRVRSGTQGHGQRILSAESGRQHVQGRPDQASRPLLPESSCPSDP